MRVYRPRDLCSERGARENVALLRRYWWGRAHVSVDAWPIRLMSHRKQPVWGVKSNLVNGKPA